MAGPNGAGKTTFAMEYLPNEAGVVQFVNADLIAAGLSPFAPHSAHIRAGRVMLQRIDELAAQGRSFAFETTMAGHGYLARIRQWKATGAHVSIYFLKLSSPELSMDRVAARVREGGHDVPSQVIRRRFWAGWANFDRFYRDAVDSWIVYDCDGLYPIKIEESTER